MHAKGGDGMRHNVLNMIGIERTIAGWRDDAVEKEQSCLKLKNTNELLELFYKLRDMRETTGNTNKRVRKSYAN